jgi:hypothetical protein
MSIGAYLNEVNRLKGLGHTIEEAQRIADAPGRFWDIVVNMGVQNSV